MQAQVEQAKSGAEQEAGKIKAKSAQAKDKAATGWQDMNDKW